MHGLITKIKGQYPFRFSHYYSQYWLQSIADSVQEIRSSPALFFTLSEEIRKVRQKATPEDTDKIIHDKLLTPIQKINLLGLMSFSSNGYVRHAALKALTHFKSPSVFPYIILRLQDWVAPIREQAASEFTTYAALASPQDWEDCALLIHKISERSHGTALKKFVKEHLVSRFTVEQRAGWFLGAKNDMRRLLWDIFTDDELVAVATPAFITSESDTRLASEIFQKLTKILPRSDVMQAGFGHASYRIRYAALQALYSLDDPELKSVTEAALSDKSASVRELARFILFKRFNIHPRDHYKGFDLAPDNGTAKLGYIMGWLESSRADPERFLEFFYRSPRGKVRGAALMAYARVAGYTEKSPGLILEALESGSHPRDVAAKLIRMCWASEISNKLWELADRETEMPRQMRLYRLAAQSNWQYALLPALRRMPGSLPAIRDFLMDIVVKWSRLYRPRTLNEDEKIEGRVLVKSLIMDRKQKDWLNFLFL